MCVQGSYYLKYRRFIKYYYRHSTLIMNQIDRKKRLLCTKGEIGLDFRVDLP